jgi:GT2 family glycosyltransferase/glycosyltransferase involved in cell wall biosynthesis
VEQAIKVVFGSGAAALNRALTAKIAALEPGLPLYVVSEFPPSEGRWIPYHPFRSTADNLAHLRAAFRGKRIQIAAVLLEPGTPYRRLQWLALWFAPLRLLFYNENLDHFLLRPRCAGSIARHFYWRSRSLARFETHPGGHVYTFLWRLRHPSAWKRPLLHQAARAAGLLASWRKKQGATDSRPETEAPNGISVVIPSRNGRELLERLLPGLERQLGNIRSEIIVSDNGSDDGTAGFLEGRVEVESSPAALSFARAVNRGIRRARYSHVLLLNNDMILEEGFFEPLLQAFEKVPNLFCATAQILFPDGQRRQETGKAVFSPETGEQDFPLRCDVPVAGEDLSYVLYGSGGCSLYDAAKLRKLGAAGEMYEPAYVEDLDLGYRAWLRGWPTVFAAGARVLHFHRATTSRYYSERELARVLEVNYLRFLARAVASPESFRVLWNRAVRRLNLLAVYQPEYPALEALAEARHAARWMEPVPQTVMSDELVLGIGSGDVAVFPGRARPAGSAILIATPYLPFPLSHGGAVRMYNMMRRAAGEFRQVLVAFTDELATPPGELLEICTEIVLVRRRGSHRRGSTRLPDIVEEFDSPAFRAALRLTVLKHQPGVAQLEFTQMAQYARDCAPAKTLLVEHDITFDLYKQLLEQGEDWEVRRQYERWLPFETSAWAAVDRVITMSEKDGNTVTGGSSACLPNGVDVERFRPGMDPPEAGRLLFIGSFAHLPNLLALDFFLRESWPLLREKGAALHIIAGSRSQYFRDHHKDRVQVNLEQAGIELEDFVADVRPPYRRAVVVIAPLVASAGTNIKIMEAMAMGKAIVSTPAGVNGLDLTPGADVEIAHTGAEMAGKILELLANSQRRRELERQARRTAEAKYDWDRIAEEQARLYRELLEGNSRQADRSRATASRRSY